MKHQERIRISATFKKAVLRIRDVYPGSRILIFTHPGSRIPDLRSRISDPGSKNSNKREGWKKICCHTFFCSHKFHKIENYLIFEMLKKEFGPFFKEFYNFLLKKLSLCSQKYGFGIRDPRVKKAPDSGSRIRIRNTEKSKHNLMRRISCFY